MSYLNEQNVLKYNLFKALNDNREYQNLPPNKKKALEKLSSIQLNEQQDKSTIINPSISQWQENLIQTVKEKHQSEDLFIQQLEKNEPILSPVQKKKIEINKLAIQKAYQRIKERNVKDKMDKQYNSTNVSNQNNQVQVPETHFSYSRTLSSLKEFKLKEYNKNLIKKLIEKQNPMQMKTSPSNKQLFQASQVQEENGATINTTNYNSLDQKQLAFNEFQRSQRGYLNSLQSTNENYNGGQLLNSNTERESSLTATVTFNQTLNPLQNNQHKIENLEGNQISLSKRQSSFKKLNQNTNHNSNFITTMGQQFLMRKSLYEQSKIEDLQIVQNQAQFSTNRKQPQKLVQRIIKSKNKSLRDLTPEIYQSQVKEQMHSRDGDFNSRVNKYLQNFQNIQEKNQSDSNLQQFRIYQTPRSHQLKQRSQKKNLESIQFYGLPTNKNDSDQNYSSQFCNVKLPLSCKQKIGGSPMYIQRTKSITLQLTNNNNLNHSGNHTPNKISAKFRQAFKESIERHVSRENEQIAEIQKLFQDPSTQSLIQQIKDNVQAKQLSNNNKHMQQFLKENPQIFSQNKNSHLQKEIVQQDNSSVEWLTSSRAQQNSLKFTEEEEESIQNIDTKLVFENLPVDQQLNELNYLQKAMLNSQQHQITKFIFSENHFKRKNQPQLEKKIFKV
ncbi:hypothetical protein TTHERM_00123820 (macronuclear) [Tetrahymena thermophila SB210]|uniref:Uncharacterized protein n=1 Tax=Tetrahymena thermophila (strain SB210) TaxID=312017 RepID=Q22YN9_TETTS|nr:hypothetical protein TTHERM_00123820 [Tetrahymena thermophila SB210]EAR90632.1 hypothetical protein TTHERM_00123820 [Tetrahymena thermophila SB210]|eukprot:XP_001010877.1 hypothetical protein TTHERM_00123820 [Tetrahymena thermophila SB210]